MGKGHPLSTVGLRPTLGVSSKGGGYVGVRAYYMTFSRALADAGTAAPFGVEAPSVPSVARPSPLKQPVLLHPIEHLLGQPSALVELEAAIGDHLLIDGPVVGSAGQQGFVRIVRR